MYPFLILSSLSVGFYLFLLVALHRDGRVGASRPRRCFRMANSVAALAFSLATVERSRV